MAFPVQSKLVTNGGLQIPSGASSGYVATSDASGNVSWAPATGGGATIGWAAVRVASTVNVNTASPGATIDGITMVSGDRVLLKDQNTPSQNGIYLWNGAAVAMTRTTDADVSGEFLDGNTVGVQDGTVNADTEWTYVTTGAVTLGTTSLRFTRSFPAYGQRTKDFWTPGTNPKIEPRDRAIAGTNVTALTTQVIYAVGGVTIPAGMPIAGVNFHSGGTAAGTPTNQWAGIMNASSRTIRAISADALTAAWAANSLKTFTWSAYTPDVDEPVYVFLMVKATAVPSLLGWNVGAAAFHGQAPILVGSSNTAQTVPLTVGTVATALTALGTGIWLSLI